MKRRTSVIFEKDAYESLERRAQQSGSTVSDQIRLAVDMLVASQPAASDWEALFEAVAAAAEPRPGPFPDIHSPEAEERRAGDVYQDAFNRSRIGRESS